MKRIIIVLLAILLGLFLFVSCGYPDFISCYGDEEPELDGKDVVDDAPYPTKSLGIGVEYVIFRGGSIECENYTLTKIESFDEVKSFIKANKLHTLDGYQYHRAENFENYSKHLADNFFDEHILLVVNIISGSGSTRFYATGYDRYGENEFTVGISSVMREPYAPSTCDMASWHMVFEIERTLVDGIDKFTAINKTLHTAYVLDSGSVQTWITLDKNDRSCFLSHGKYLEENYNGAFNEALWEMTLALGDDKLVFDIEGDAFERLVYNQKKSKHSLELPFEDGAVFNLRK